MFAVRTVDGSCYRVIHQFYKSFFHLPQNVDHAVQKETLGVDKTRQKLRDKTTKK